MFCGFGVRVLWNPFFPFFAYLDLSHDFNAHICFNSFFTVHITLGFRKCQIGMLFDRKPEKLLSQTLYRTRDAAHVILNVYAKKMP